MNGDSKYVDPGVLRGGKAVEDGADMAIVWFRSSCGDTVCGVTGDCDEAEPLTAVKACSE